MLYSTDMLLDKNKDYVVAENAALVASSASAFVRGLLPSPEDGGADHPGGTQRRNAFKLNSVGAQFRSQVRRLGGLPCPFGGCPSAGSIRRCDFRRPRWPCRSRATQYGNKL